jgi:glycosyltransferase involved in cell wall biosynthesis
MEELVSIGVPVKNGFEGKLRNNLNLEKAIKSILNQSYKKIEIIISNDCSTDNTEEYLTTIAKIDNRIFLYNQKKELGLGPNFRFVLEKSTGKYFKWNAQDDIISKDYIKNNIKFLQTNPSYIASSSKFSYENNLNKFYSYDLDKNLYSRINNFFDIRHISHNLTHSLIRKKYIFKTTDFTNDYWAIDWIFDLELLIYGKFKTIKKGYVIFGMKGLSKKKEFFFRKSYKKKWIYKLIPFYELMKILFLKTIFVNELNLLQKIHIYLRMIKINFHFFKMKLKTFL